jgi:hypothetical protein
MIWNDRINNHSGEGGNEKQKKSWSDEYRYLFRTTINRLMGNGLCLK